MRFHSADSIASLPARVLQGWRDAPLFSPMQAPGVYELYERHIAAAEGEQALYCYLVDDAGNFLAMLPLSSHHERFQRKLRAMGNYYTIHVGLVTALDADRNACSEAIINGLLAHGASFSSLDIVPLLPSQPDFQPLIKACKSRFGYTESYHHSINWRHEFDDLDAFRQGLSGRTRSTIKRKGKKLSERHRWEVNISGELTPEIMGDYWRIYASSWKVEEPYPEFLEEFYSYLAAERWLRMGTLYVDGKAAASQVWIVSGKTAYIYKLAYDPQFRDYSVGTLLTWALARHVIEQDKVTCIDYMSGDDAYKKDWMTTREEIVGIVSINRHSLSGRLLQLALRAWRHLEKLRP